MTKNIEIKKILLEEKDVPEKELKFIPQLHVSYRNIDIHVSQCPNHINEFYIKAEGLGSRMDLIYWYTGTDGQPLQEFLEEIFADFCAYVLIWRDEETHDAIH